MSRILISLFVLISVSLTVPGMAQETSPDDHRALAGLTTGKAIFDVSSSSPESLLLYLNVIEKTVATLKAQGVTPDFILAFRGAAVSIASKESEFNSPEQETALAAKIAVLKQQGVYFEACNVAAGLYDVEKENLFPGVVMVGNTFASLIGYQSQGYALIPLN